MSEELEAEEEIIARLDQIEREILVGMEVIFEGLFADSEDVKEMYNQAIQRRPEDE